MKVISIIGALLLSAPAVALPQNSPVPPGTNVPPPASTDLVQPPRAPGQMSSNPWDSLPAMTPYRKLADDIKAQSGQAPVSPLNPSCAGKTGEECVREAEVPKR